MGTFKSRIYAFAVALITASMVAAAPGDEYRGRVIREGRAAWGLEAPVAVFAGQIAQESAFRADVRSPVGAEGLAQIMPATGRWLVDIYPADLGATPQPFSPAWAIRAMVLYDRHLFVRTRGHTDCDRWWFTLRGYNGGLGHLQREARLAADPLDRHAVDAQCGRARRGAVHCPENLGYPRRILYVHQARYSAWGPGVPC